MRYCIRNISCHKYRGDLGLTIAIVLFVTLLVGSFVGIQILKKPTGPSSAYLAGDCGTVCEQVSDCKRIDSEQGIGLTCAENIGRCMPANGQPQCDLEERSGGFGLCNSLCTENRMCDDDLKCDLSLPTSPTYRTCIPKNNLIDCDGVQIIHITPTITSTPTPTLGISSICYHITIELLTELAIITG